MDNREDNNLNDNIDNNSESNLEEITETIDMLKIIEEDLNINITHEMLKAPKVKKKRFAEEIFEWVEIFSSALLTVILLFTFIFRMVTVEGPSMQEPLHARDNLVISHLFYTPKQNDIVVIQLPNTTFTVPIIKRVIATEGQEINFDFENWKVYVDGVELDEPYVNYAFGQPMHNSSIDYDSLPITVEPGKIFVLGDNRNLSADSRNAQIGQVDINNVVGRVMFRVFPFDKFGVVKAHGE